MRNICGKALCPVSPGRPHKPPARLLCPRHRFWVLICLLWSWLLIVLPLQYQSEHYLGAGCFGGRAGTPFNIPLALISSSISGQWTPSPLPMISKLFRWSGVASDKRQDHARGTLIVRPSASCAVIESSEISNVIILGSLSATVCLPCFQNTFQVIHNNPSNDVKLSGREAAVGTQSDGFEPEFACHSFSADMDMLRLIAIEAVEEYPIWPGNILNPRH